MAEEIRLNASIVCPQCGAAGGFEYRTNHFICPHCDSKYRWVDPHRHVVQIQSPVCVCGKSPFGACTECGVPVCESHHTDLHIWLKCWQFLRLIYAEFDPRISKFAERSHPKLRRWKRTLPGWFQRSSALVRMFEVRHSHVHVSGPFDREFLDPLLDQAGIRDRKLSGLLCFHCAEERFITLGPLLDSQAGQFLREGRFCNDCLTLREAGDPELSHEVIPRLASITCTDCGQRVCEEHQHSCPACRVPLCQHHPYLYCADCRWKPWRWFGLSLT